MDRNWNTDSQIYMEIQRTLNSKTVFQREQIWILTLPNSKTHYKITVLNMDEYALWNKTDSKFNIILFMWKCIKCKTIVVVNSMCLQRTECMLCLVQKFWRNMFGVIDYSKLWLWSLWYNSVDLFKCRTILLTWVSFIICWF